MILGGFVSLVIGHQVLQVDPAKLNIPVDPRLREAVMGSLRSGTLNLSWTTFPGQTNPFTICPVDLPIPVRLNGTFPAKPVTLGGDYWMGSWCRALLTHGYSPQVTQPWLSSGWVAPSRTVRDSVQMPGTVQNIKVGAVYSNAFTLQRGKFWLRVGGGTTSTRTTDPKPHAELWVDGVRTTVIPRIDPGGNVTTNAPVATPPYPNFGRLGAFMPSGKETMEWQSLDIADAQVGKRACVVIIDESSSGHLNVGEAANTMLNMPMISSSTAPLMFGWADLHTHPAAHLAFGAGSDDFKGAIWGRPGMSFPASDAQLRRDLPSCDANSHGSADSFQIVAAESGTAALVDALVTVFTGGAVPPGLITVGGSLTAAATSSKQVIEARKLVLDAIDEDHRGTTPHGRGGYPDFNGWPTTHSVVHQQMHINWMKRAYDGGCRMIVASAVDNQLIASGLNANVGALLQVDPQRDFDSVVRQVEFIKRWVAANSSWMKLALTPSDLEDAIEQNKMAVVLGTEVDMIQDVDKVQALFDMGVRHFTLIHLMNNELGGTAAFKDLFNFNNLWAHKKPIFVVEGSNVGVDFKFSELPQEVRQILVGVDRDATRQLPTGYRYDRFRGQINVLGITTKGLTVYEWLRSYGAIIDLAHMGNQAVETLLERMSHYRAGDLSGYPMVFSHGGLRSGEPNASGNERSLTEAQAARMLASGGLMGLGTNGGNAVQFGVNLRGARQAINTRNHRLADATVPMAMGSDVNGLDGFVQPRPTGANRVLYVGDRSTAGRRTDQIPLSVCTTGNKSWNYNSDGAVHFGMFPDWLQDWFNDAVAAGRADENQAVMSSAEAYLKTWRRADSMKTARYTDR